MMQWHRSRRRHVSSAASPMQNDGSKPSQVRLSMSSISVGRHRLTRQLGSLFDAIAQTLNLDDEIDEIRELLDADRRDMPEICSRE